MQILLITDFQKAIERAKDILYEKVDKKSVLFLSGGATPKSLYASLAKDKIIRPAAVGLIDERYGKKLHEKSNERMVQETGLLDYLKDKGIPFYPIISSSSAGVNGRHPKGVIERIETAKAYDRKTRDLFFHFHKSVAVMGIGSDGHTSSIIPNRKDFTDPMFAQGEKQMFVGEFNDTKSDYKERIGMTFAGLSLIDYFIVLAFGKEKKEALQKMFERGSLEEVPARFFMQRASDTTVVITDQQV